MNMQTSTGSGSSRPNKDQSAGDDTAQMTAALTAPTALRKLVLNYLVHHCYVDTAQAFVDDGSGSGGGGSGSGSGLGNGVSPAMPASTRSATGKEAEHGAAASGASISQSMPAINCHGSTRRHVSRGHANPQAHPLAAPPLSREDSSMEVEVDSLLALANGGPSGTGRGTDPVNGTNSEKRQAGAVRSGVEALDKAASRSDDELPADELHNVRVRKDVRDCILTGRIRQAIDLCTRYFPSVLSVEGSATLGNRGGGPASTPSLRPAEKEKTRTKSATKDEAPEDNPRILPSNPTSLDPAHLWLNLHIQAFIETMRSASSSLSGGGASASPAMSSVLTGGGSHQGASAMPSLHSLVSSTPGIAAATMSRSASPAPSSASSSAASITSGNGLSGSVHSANGGGPGGSSSTTTVNAGIQTALQHAQWLFGEVHRLPSYWRAMYLKELESVTAMLAYTDLERSPMRKYLDQSRRVALAEQINSAIVFRTGKPSQPLIESAVRQTTFAWSTLAHENIGVPTNHPFFSSGLAASVDGAASDFAGLHARSLAGAGGTLQQPSSSSTSKNKSKVLPPWDLHSFLRER